MNEAVSGSVIDRIAASVEGHLVRRESIIYEIVALYVFSGINEMVVAVKVGA
jgi:hypothetical protein